MNDNITIYILICTIVALITMFIYVAFARNKQTLHRIVILLIFQLIIWNGAVLLGCIYKDNVEVFLFIEKFPYFGAAFVPITLIFLALAYDKNYKGFSWKIMMLYIIPIFTMIMVWTNDSHHLFYESYSTEKGYVLGPYFYIYAVYSYLCMITGMFYLCYFAFKNKGKLSVQAILILLGCLFPTVTNICYTFGVPGFSVSSTPIAFTITILFYILAMIKFDFLKVMPVALQTVINRISDSFVVVNNDLNIIDYNTSFKNNFINDNTNSFKTSGFTSTIISWMKSFEMPLDTQNKIMDKLVETFESRNTTSMDLNFHLKDEMKYYTVEFTPITDRSSCNAIIILFKDITQHVLDLDTIKKNQEVLLERERLASLGQMIGGIAHNLKTPIMSVSGGIEQVENLAMEYRDSIDDKEVLPEDHKEIAGEMLSWLQKMKNHMSYMSDIISTVKDQAAQFNASQNSSFSIDKLIKRVKILMQHELVKNNCTLTFDLNVDDITLIKGDINSLIQIIDNIIVNAIQSYGDIGGEIVVKVWKEHSIITFQISDTGSGIDEKVQDQLFKKMITTKGKHGTGLGLYMSYSTIKGVFGGNMWFESKVGKGTSFFIQIPLVLG